MPKIKNSNYFPHDCSARDDQKLLKVRGRFGLEGYAIFWMCLESMSTNGGYIESDSVSGLAVTFGTSEAQLMAQLEYLCEVGLFLKNKEGYHSSRMDEHLLFRKERSESGKKGAETRWKDSSAIAQPMAESMQSKVKESKVNKEKNIYGSLSSLNEEVYGDIAKQYSVSVKSVTGLSEELRLYCQSRGKKYANYKAALQNWTRRAIEVKKITKIAADTTVDDDPDYDPEIAKQNLAKIMEMKKNVLGV